MYVSYSAFVYLEPKILLHLTLLIILFVCQLMGRLDRLWSLYAIRSPCVFFRPINT